VLRAYKLRAFDTQPDRGGTAAQFIAVRRAYEATLKLFGGAPGTAANQA
jgi:hypothetical protein